MTRLYAGRPAPQWWPMPPGVASWPVDPASGLVLSEGCAPADGAAAPRELFLVGHEPMSTCPGVTAAASNLLEGTTEGVPAASSGEESQIEIGPARAAAGTAEEAGAGEAGGGETGGGGGAGAGAAEGGQAGERAATVPPSSDAAGRRAAPLPPSAPPAPSLPPTPATGAISPDEQEAEPPGREARPPAGGRGAEGAAAANLGGWWQVTNTGDATGAEARGARTYRIALRQEGSRVSGAGEEWEEGGRQLAAGARTRIELSGSIAGREVRLRYTERGPGGTASGTITWRLAGGGGELSGTFSSAGSDARGASSAVRLQ
jgi:hypothetical protein